MTAERAGGPGPGKTPEAGTVTPDPALQYTPTPIPLILPRPGQALLHVTQVPGISGGRR